jgi:hypothetical protein
VRTRALALLTALALAISIAGCGGGDSGPRLTLTDGECTYDGDETVPSTGTLEIEIVNESTKLGAFEIASIGEGGTFAGVEEYVASEQERIESGRVVRGPPAYLTNLARAQVSPGDSGTLVATVNAGEHVLWCAQEHPPTALFLITPALQVSE